MSAAKGDTKLVTRGPDVGQDGLDERRYRTVLRQEQHNEEPQRLGAQDRDVVGVDMDGVSPDVK